jgi:folate-dependent phosphoribosylglycinamide formyltransferase PurN
MCVLIATRSVLKYKSEIQGLKYIPNYKGILGERQHSHALLTINDYHNPNIIISDGYIRHLSYHILCPK